MATEKDLVPVTPSGNSVPSTPSIEGSTAHMSEPNVIKGAILIMKQVIVATVLGVSSALFVPSVIATPPTPVEGVVEDDGGWVSKAGSIWAGTKDRAVALKDSVINSDERLESAKRMVDAQNKLIADLQREIATINIQRMANHAQMLYCAQDLVRYLEGMKEVPSHEQQ